jgi:integrase
MKRNRKASWPRGLLSYDAKSGRAVIEVIVPGKDARGRFGTRRRQKIVVLDEFVHAEAAIQALRAEVRGEFPRAPWAEGAAENAAPAPAPDAPIPTFAEYVATYRASILSHYAQGSSRSNRGSILDCHLVPAFGPKRLDAITDADVSDFVGAMKTKTYDDGAKHYSPATINTALSLFGRFLRDAVRRRVLAALPLRERMPRLDEILPENELRDDERAKFVAAFDNFEGFQAWLEANQPKGRTRAGATALFGGKRRVGSGMRSNSKAARRYFERFRAARHLFIVSMETGIRREDLRMLVSRSVRFDEGVIRFRMRKTKKQVEIPMSKRCREALLAARERSTGDIVFVTPAGKPYSISVLRRMFKIAKTIAGIRRPFRIHDIRHTFASRLVSRGENLKVVSELLGHRSIKMTERYARLSPDAKRSVVARLDDDAIL